MNPEALPHCSQLFTASLGAADRSWFGVLQVAADHSYFHEAAGAQTHATALDQRRSEAAQSAKQITAL